MAKPVELLEMYLHHASELLLKIHHMTDMALIPTEVLNHDTIVYGLNSTKLKDKVAGHQSAYWETMEDCFSDIHAFGNGYERAKGYSKVEFDAPGAQAVNEVKSSKEPGPCFKCDGPHF